MFVWQETASYVFLVMEVGALFTTARRSIALIELLLLYIWIIFKASFSQWIVL